MRFPAILPVSIVLLVLLAGCGEASTTSSGEPSSTSAPTTTPERRDSPTATDEATRWLGERIAGQQIDLVVDRTDRDQYGRLLRYVEVDGTDAGAELVRAGLALARRYPPAIARHEEYEAAQQAAEDAGTGLWAADACGGGSTEAEVVISETRFDAEGDDNQNLNDEWVRITNQGSAVWSDSGDTAFLVDPAGAIVDSQPG